MKTLTFIFLALFAAPNVIWAEDYQEASTAPPATSTAYPQPSTSYPNQPASYYPTSQTCGCKHTVGHGWYSQYTENCGLTPPKNGDPYGCGCASSCNFLGSNCECNCKWKPGFLRGCDKKPDSECPITY